MAIHKSIPNSLIAIAWILSLSLTISCTFSARLLIGDDIPDDPDSPQTPLLPNNPAGPGAIPVGPTGPIATPVVPIANPVVPIATPVVPIATPVVPIANPVVPLNPGATPIGPVGPVGTPIGPIATPVSPVTPGVPVTTPVGPTTGTATTTGGGPASTNADPHHTFTFYMHDIVGGTNPSAIAMTGIVTNPAVSGAIPFAKPNGAVLSVNNGVPQNNNNGGIVSNNNVPFFTGLAGGTSNILQNANNGGNNNFIAGGSGFPFINGAQLPPGMTLQTLMFGTMTAFDDELTEGHEIGSGLIGKAQGFYVASSVDGTSQTMAFTTMFQSGGYADSLTFFGVHMTAAAESYLAVMGGTGQYLNARGFALVKTFPPSLDQHNTDGIETLLQITVYLSY